MPPGNFNFKKPKNRKPFGKTRNQSKRGEETIPWQNAMPVWVDSRSHVKSFDGNVYDVTQDIIDGSISRQVDSPMTLSITLANSKDKYRQLFIPGDQIVVWLRRGENEYQAFTGYIKRTPMARMITQQEITLEAECLIRRFKTKYWDPQLPENVIALSSSPDKESFISPDQTLAFLLTAPEYLGIDPKNIFIQRFPEIWIDRANKISEQNPGCLTAWEDLINCDDPCGPSDNLGADSGLSAAGCPDGATIGSIIDESGWPDAEKERAVQTVYCESTGNAGAFNPNGPGGQSGGPTGLFQIVLTTAQGVDPQATVEKLKDPLYNSSTALKLWKQQGWSPWACKPGVGQYGRGSADTPITGCTPTDGGGGGVEGDEVQGVRIPENLQGFDEFIPLPTPVGSGPGSGGVNGLGTAYILGVEKPAYVLSHFLKGDSQVQRPNKGVDIAAKSGNTIRAWKPGRILLTGYNGMYKHFIVAKMGREYILFSHLRSKSFPVQNTHFGAGDIIGKVATGRELGTRETFVHIEMFDTQSDALNLDSRHTRDPLQYYEDYTRIVEDKGRIKARLPISDPYQVQALQQEEYDDSPIYEYCTVEVIPGEEFTISAAPLGYDLVDNREIRYTVNSNYANEFRAAAERWNSLGGVKIYENNSSPTLRVSDGETGALAKTYSDGRIVFSPSKMGGATQNAREAAAMHELGHALGFEHQDQEPSVMKSIITTNRSDNYSGLTDYDIKKYREVWGGSGDPDTSGSGSGDLDGMTQDGLGAQCTEYEWGGGHDEEEEDDPKDRTKVSDDPDERLPGPGDVENETPGGDPGSPGVISITAMGKNVGTDTGWKDAPKSDGRQNTRNLKFTGARGVLELNPNHKKGVDASGLFNRLRRKQGLVPGEIGSLADWFEFLVNKEPFRENKPYPHGTILINPGSAEEMGHMGMVIDDKGTILDVNADTRMVNTKFRIEESNQGWAGYTHAGMMPDIGIKVAPVETKIPNENPHGPDYLDEPISVGIEDQVRESVYDVGPGTSKPHVSEANGIVEKKFGVNGTTYPDHGVPGGGPISIDWTINGWSGKATGDAKRKGDELAGFMESNWKAFNVKYMIWWGLITNSPGGWKTYEGGGGYQKPNPNNPSAMHQDHVHVTFQGSGSVGEYTDDGKTFTGENTGGDDGGSGGSGGDGEVNGYPEPCIMKNPLGVYRLFESMGDMQYSTALRRIALGLDMGGSEADERAKWDLLGFPEEAYINDMNTEIRDWSQIAELRKEPYMNAVQDVASAGLYQFQSLGTGEIVFWYPDILYGIEDWVLAELKEKREDVEEDITQEEGDEERIQAEIEREYGTVKKLEEEIAALEKKANEASGDGPAGEGLIQADANRLRDRRKKLRESRERIQNLEDQLVKIDAEISDREDFSGTRFDTTNVDIITKKMRVQDIDLEDFHLYVSDEELVTHYYCAGDFQMEGSFSDTPPFIPCWRWSTIFTHPFFRKMANDGFDWKPEAFIQKYGSRPKKDIRDNIKTPGMAQIWADYEFLKQWLRCYTIDLKTTFMPELYPGQSIEIDSLGVQCQIVSASHSFGSSWETNVSCSMPLAVGDRVTDSEVPPLPFWSLIPTSYLEDEELGKLANTEFEPYLTAPLGDGDLDEAIQLKREQDRQTTRDFLEEWRYINQDKASRDYREDLKDNLGLVPRIDGEDPTERWIEGTDANDPFLEE